LKPETLTYRFHKFRPSDRKELRQVLSEDGNVDVFVSALDIFLKKWAEGDWLADYDIERVAVWCAIHLGSDVNAEVARLLETELSASQTEQANRVYNTFQDEFRKNLLETSSASETAQSASI